ncbi:tyrosine-protein kinase domain-containing protein [Ktedonosporobacter rubrisoli]|nr:tyrosine-protein kinase domain-containing protein [Ktedonosporobacter rubrisoli]
MKIIVRAFVRWSWLLVLCIVVGFVVGRVVSSTLPPTYQATSVVQLSSQTRTSQTQIIQPVASYSTLVTSDPVLNPVLKQYPQLDRQTFIAKQLVVTPDTPSNSFQIQVTLPEARVSADIANRLALLLVAQQNLYIKEQYTKAIQLANQRIASEQKAIDSLNQQYAATPATNTALLSQLASQIDQQRNIQNTDIASQQALITEQALYNAPLSVVSSAVPATKPSSILGSLPLVPVMIILFLSLGIVFISFLEQSTGRINSTYVLQQKTAVPVLGSLSWAKPMPPDELGLAKTQYSEECRMMMADVMFQAEKMQARILALTGLREEAGTSSVAAQLAVLLAQSNRRVLLIDANLYRPSLHTQLRVSNEVGLAMLLEEARKAKVNAPAGKSDHGSVETLDKLSIERFILPLEIPNLYILPAGITDVNPGDLLSMPEMGQFLKWAASPVDFVIIDCPALDHGEAHILGTLSDQTLLIVDATRDRLKQVMMVKNDLADGGIKLAGMIVNKLGRWV